MTKGKIRIVEIPHTVIQKHKHFYFHLEYTFTPNLRINLISLDYVTEE